MSATPYGLRQIRLVKGASVVEFPIAQTADCDFQFSGGELKGDDILWKKLAILESVKITLKNGGLSSDALALLLNGALSSDAGGSLLTFNGGEVVQQVSLFAKTMGPDGDDIHVKFYQVTLDTAKVTIGQAAFSVNDNTLTAVRDSHGRMMDIVHNVTTASLPTVQFPYTVLP